MNWKKFALKIATERTTDPRNSYNVIQRSAEVVFDYDMEDHSTPNMTGEKFKLIYNWIMTTAVRKGLLEKDKVSKVIEFVELLNTRVDYIIETLKWAGYNIIPETNNEEFNKRNFHKEVISHCGYLYNQGNYFHAVNEACKAYNNKVKELSGSNRDGIPLMQQVFSSGKIKVNPNITDSEKNEQNGIKALSEGLMSAFRNPTAHENASDWIILPDDALDILSLVSYLFKKLESAKVQP